jgi:glutamine synthetase type III
LREASTRKPIKFEETGRKSVLFGSNVFNDKAMKQYLTSDAFKGVQGAVQHGTKIDRKLIILQWIRIDSTMIFVHQTRLTDFRH